MLAAKVFLSPVPFGIREAFATVQEPQEQWERRGRQFYLKTFADPSGRLRRMVVITQNGKVETWMPTDSKSGKGLERQRKGTLRQMEGAPG